MIRFYIFVTMATFYCSVIIPPNRFVSREKIDALCMFDAFLQMSHKYKPMNKYGVIYKCEYRGRCHYFDFEGKRIE